MKFKKLRPFLWMMFLILYLECIYRIFIFETFFDLELLYLLVFSLPIALLFYLITSMFSEKINKILNTVLTFLLCLIFAAQVVYFNFYQSMFSVFSLMNGTGQVLQFAQDIFKIMLGVWYILLLLFLPFILFLIFNKKLFSFKRLKLKQTIVILILMILSYFGGFLIIQLDNKGSYSLNKLYYGTHAPMVTAQKLGLLTMTRYDLVRYFFGFAEETYIDPSEVKEEKPEIKYNKLDINFETLIANENNESIKKMHEYFSKVNATSQNEYTGMFEGKNIVFITAEGFDTLAIDEVLTPSLYKLANNGFIFNNFYQPLYPVSTSDGEYMNITSLIPKEGVWSAYRTSKNYMPFALGNMFKDTGYLTKGYHNHSYKYYDRHLSHPNFGFDYMGCGNGLEKRMNCRIWPESDYEMLKVTVDDYIYTINQETPIEQETSVEQEITVEQETQKFASYYMTVSGHLNYSRTGNNMANRNWDAVKNLPYSDAIKAYIACNIEFDKAIEYLLNSLENAGILQDTVIVISPDHYPYGLKNERDEMSEILGYDREDKFENYRTTLIIYNSEMEKVEVNKYASSIDILPTVYNLFGLDFDSRLLMGRDILSTDEEGLVILSDRSWISDKGKYNSIKDEFIPFDQTEEISEDYVSTMNSLVNGRFSMSSLIINHNYYNHLELINEN